MAKTTSMKIDNMNTKVIIKYNDQYFPVLALRAMVSTLLETSKQNNHGSCCWIWKRFHCNPESWKSARTLSLPRPHASPDFLSGHFRRCLNSNVYLGWGGPFGKREEHDSQYQCHSIYYVRISWMTHHPRRINHCITTQPRSSLRPRLLAITAIDQQPWL